MNEINKDRNQAVQNYSIADSDLNVLKGFRAKILESNHFWALSDFWLEIIPKFEFNPSNSGLCSTERRVLRSVNLIYNELENLSGWNLKGFGRFFFSNIHLLIREYMLKSGYVAVLNQKRQFWEFKRVV